MKRTVSTITLLIILLFCLTGGASAIVGLRGATWGEIRYLIPRDDGDEDNLLLDGWIRQGIDLAKWSNTTLNAYGTLRYRLDTEKTDWYNSLGPGVGVAFETFNAKGIVGSIGAEYIWEHFYEMDESDEKVVVFVNWYGWWDLMKR
jgi:hypothetical protein